MGSLLIPPICHASQACQLLRAQLHTILWMCAGPAASPKAAAGGKLPPGAEAVQVNAAAGLRIMTLHDECKRQLVDLGAIPVLLPLLGTSLNPVRWSVRQARHRDAELVLTER